MQKKLLHLLNLLCYVMFITITFILMFFKVIRHAEEHIRIVSRERNHYRYICEETRKQLKSIFSKDGTFCPPPKHLCFEAMSLDCEVHYSFDMAQQVGYSRLAH